MKHIYTLLIAIGLLSESSFAALVATTGPVGLYAGAGTGKLISAHATLDACSSAALVLSTKPADYTCKARVTVAPMPDMHSGIPVNAAAIPASAAGYSTDRIMPSPPSAAYVPGATNVGAFRDSCGYSHMSFDDPIVYPGQPGKSHLHVFFGNTGVNANSTAKSISESGDSTCGGGTANRTGYWVPAMIDTKNGTPVTPLSVNVYYKTGYKGVKNEDVKPFPAGLRMIAGDSTATVDNGGPGAFACDLTSGSSGWSKTIPDCKPSTGLEMTIEFPQCWDGVNLDSPDHKSHMAYASGSCPSTHPVALAEITFVVWYQTPDTAHAVNLWRLSSDAYQGPAGYSAHGDWFNGWKQDVMTTWVTNCLNKSLDCHDFVLGDGNTLY